jgi:hypothetical protein
MGGGLHMKIVYVRINFDDDVPRMGMGSRCVIAQIGRKLVTLYNPFTKKRKVISLIKYLSLSPAVLENDRRKILKLIPKGSFPQLRRVLSEC